VIWSLWYDHLSKLKSCRNIGEAEMSDLKGDPSVMSCAPTVGGSTGTGYSFECCTDYEGMTTYITLRGIWTVTEPPALPVTMPPLYTTKDGNTQVGFCFLNMAGTQYSGTCILLSSDTASPQMLTITYPWTPPS
jgi:hypothetical protein